MRETLEAIKRDGIGVAVAAGMLQEALSGRAQYLVLAEFVVCALGGAVPDLSSLPPD